MFFWNSLAFSMIQWMLAIWSLVLLSFLNPAWTSGSSRFMYCWSLAWKILSITLLAWEMTAIVWWLEHCLVLSFLGTGMRIDLFQSCGHCWVFQIYWLKECNTLMASPFRVLISSTGIPSNPLALIRKQGFLSPPWLHSPDWLWVADHSIAAIWFIWIFLVQFFHVFLCTWGKQYSNFYML